MSTEPNPVAPQEYFLNGFGIQRIFVSELFGEDSYELRARAGDDGSAPRVLLLYGDNGSGKTTILNILFYLLSHIDKVGHKSKIRKYVFKAFVIEFADGMAVAANRDHPTDGPYRLSVIRNGSVIAETTYAQPFEGTPVERIRQERRHDEEHERVLQALESLKLRIVFLRHTRKIVTNISPEDMRGISGFLRGERAHRIVDRDDEDDVGAGLNLDQAMQAVSRWAIRQAFQGSSQGEQDVNQIFSQVIARLAKADFSTGSEQLDSLVSDLLTQRDRFTAFARFGLVSQLDLTSLLDALEHVPMPARGSVTQVLSPYVSSLKARLDALEQTRAQFATFIELMNSFYRNKTVHINAERGLSISARNGMPLRPRVLSSGEGQLLYLLATTLIAKERPSIFIIDEPEISLNIKWQRQLLRSLLELTKGSQIQFIFATHSIELLSRHRDFVAVLDSLESDAARPPHDR